MNLHRVGEPFSQIFQLNCTVRLGEDHNCGDPIYDLNDVVYKGTIEKILPLLNEAEKNPNYQYYNRTFKVRAFKIHNSKNTMCLTGSDKNGDINPGELIKTIQDVQSGNLSLQPCTQCDMPQPKFKQTIMKAKRLSLDNFM